MEFNQTELMNEYVTNQNKMIGDLINKNLMLESKLKVALNTIEGLEAKAGKKAKDEKIQDFK